MICPEDNQPCTLDHSQACYNTCATYKRNENHSQRAQRFSGKISGNPWPTDESDGNVVSMIKTVRMIEWVLVGLALVIIIIAGFFAQDNPVRAMVLGVIAIAIAVSLSFVTTYLDKHDYTNPPSHN